MSYKATYDAAKLNPEKFWMEAAEKVDWITPPSKALFDDNAPFSGFNLAASYVALYDIKTYSSCVLE